MNEITPDLIAKIATRLFNEIPAAGVVPTTESDLAHLPAVPAGLPAGRPPSRPTVHSFAGRAGRGCGRPGPRAAGAHGRRSARLCRANPHGAVFARREPARSGFRRGFEPPAVLRALPDRGSAPPVRRGGGPPGLPRPAPVGARKAVGLAGQRRHDAETAGRDRRRVGLLRARQLEHPSRGTYAGGPRDRRL